MTNLLQVLSDKAKETREQIARTVQAPGSAAALPKIDQLGRPQESKTRTPYLEQELQELLPSKLVAPSQAPASPADNVQPPPKPEEALQQPVPSHIRLALVGIAVLCLLYTHLEPVVRWLKSSSFLLDMIALVCIVAAAPAIPRAQLQQSIQAAKLQVISASVAVKALPQMSLEMSAMLEEIRAMRKDVGGMAKKAAWLPGS